MLYSQQVQCLHGHQQVQKHQQDPGSMKTHVDVIVSAFSKLLHPFCHHLCAVVEKNSLHHPDPSFHKLQGYKSRSYYGHLKVNCMTKSLMLLAVTLNFEEHIYLKIILLVIQDISIIYMYDNTGT